MTDFLIFLYGQALLLLMPDGSLACFKNRTLVHSVLKVHMKYKKKVADGVI